MTTGIPDKTVLVIHDNPQFSYSIETNRCEEIEVTEVSALSAGLDLLRQTHHFDLILISMRLARYQSEATSCIACSEGSRTRIFFLNDVDDDFGFKHIRQRHCIIASPHASGWNSIFNMIFQGITPMRQSRTSTPAVRRRFGCVASEPGSEKLTPRQLQVLQLIRRGMSNRDIASQLNLTEGTVKLHNTCIFKSLGVRNRTEAALAAQSWLQ